MRIDLPPSDFEPLVRRIVEECVRQLNGRAGPARSDRQEASPAKLLVNSLEAAKLLGVSERTLWELKRSGELPFVPMGNGSQRDSVRYSVADLQAFIARRKRSGNVERTIADSSSPTQP